jgi:hypothetical protein
VDSLNLAIENLTSPPVIAFALGALAVVVRSDLRLPDPIHTWLATYLLLAIGIKGGHALRVADPADLVWPAVATVAVGLLIPVVVFPVARRLLGVSVADAGSIAAHYGSVSVVTFTAALVFAREAGFDPEGYLATLVALLEIPGIVVALLLATAAGQGTSLRAAVREVCTGRSVLLLVGGLVMGLVASDNAYARVEPFFVGLFTGLLVLFLLDLGATAAERLREHRSLTLPVVAFGIVTPLVLGLAGVAVGTAAGLSPGGAAVFGAMTASASYIAAPAAVRVALPTADGALSIGLALGVTFPFNLAIGIPVYLEVARALA